MAIERQSIGRENAIKLAGTKWWEGKSPRDVAEVQLFTSELCMPFDEFHKAVEAALGRSVWTHEFAYDGLCQEFLGERKAPTMTDILNLIPEEKRIVIAV